MGRERKDRREVEWEKKNGRSERESEREKRQLRGGVAKSEK